MINKSLRWQVLFYFRGNKNWLFAISIIFFPILLTAKEAIYEIDINITRDATLQMFQLPERLYWENENRNINQMMIVDKFGSKLPFEISQYPGVITREKSVLKMYPLSESRYLKSQTGSLLLNYDKKNHLIEIKKNKTIKKSNKIVGYLIDQGEKYPHRNSQIIFSLSDVTKTAFLKFTIDESNNLKDWRNISEGEVLAQLVNNKDITLHNKINLKNIRARFLRLSITNKTIPFEINSAEQYFSREAPEILVWTEIKNMLYSKKEKGFLLDLSPVVAYKKIKVKMPPAPSIITTDIFLQKSISSGWSYYSRLNLINISDKNTQILDNVAPIFFVRKNKMKLTIRYANPQINQESIKVSLAYAPQKVTFFANGNAPYRLHLSSNKSRKTQNNNPQLLNSIKNKSNHSIGNATLGELRIIEVDSAAGETRFHWKTILLWVILVIGVIIMAWMAKKLLKQMD